MTVRFWIILLIGALGICTVPAMAQETIRTTSVPDVSFVAPSPSSTGTDPDQWMIDPLHRKSLNKQMLLITAEQDMAFRKRETLKAAEQALGEYDRYGQDFSYATFLQNDILLAIGGVLVLQSDPYTPVFDPYLETGKDTAHITGYSLSPSGRTLAIGVSENGAEIADVWFVSLKSRQVLDHRAGPVVVGGDSGFVWLGPGVGAFRKAATTDLVAGDPSVGAQWALYNVRTGEAGAAVLGEQSMGIKTDYGDWFGLWLSREADHVLGYLWRGNYVDAYLAPLDDVLSGQPNWQPLAGDRNIRNAEIWDDQALLVVDEPNGDSAVYLASFDGSDSREVASSSGQLSYLFASSEGSIAYVFARDGADHRIFRLRKGGATLEPVATPFEGEIDFGSYAPAYGTPGTITFDMSFTDRPWRLMRLEPNGDAELADLKGISPPQPDTGIGRARFELEYAASDAGRQVPMSIIAPASGDGPFPTIIHAYGSYGETTMNGWNPSALAWSDLGGLQAECHVRGSGYFGPAWHMESSGPDKSAATRDLIACAERLVELGLSEPGKIAVIGASAGGLVAGPAAIRRPDLIGAAIVEFGVVNPLKGLEGPNGSTQIDEFGDPRRPGDAALMGATDSVELSRTAAELPDVFLCVGFQDSRVPHWMSARLAAVMARRDLGNEVILHADAQAGHSCGFDGYSQRRAEAKQYAWLLDKFAD